LHYIFINLDYKEYRTRIYEEVRFTELKYTSLIKIIIKEENFKWHLEAFASELFILLCWEEGNRL